MNKAVIIGGSNGIGLAITENLIGKGYRPIILDRCRPEDGTLPEGSYEYFYCNLLDLDENVVLPLTADPEVSILMITAGIGRVADFEYFHPAEIKNIMTVNATATIQILRMFYERIKGETTFYCGVMGSISGWISSPMAAVYAASKAAVCRFIESVNAELEAAGIENKILNVSPGYFDGSRFYGGQNRLNLLESFAEEILKHLFASERLYIPQYNETFKAVLERYHSDPNEFGCSSYRYKKNSDRADNQKRVIIGYLSGTFDLFHVGHLNLLRRAKQNCDYLLVGVHESGAWKGKETFIPYDERIKIVGACKYVDRVVKSCREDSDAWELWHFDRLFVGSDYKGTARFNRYEEFFQDKNVEIVYFPYTQTTNSTQIRRAILLKTKDLSE